MAVKIRLRRMGRKKQPQYRIVVADSDSPRDGRFVESLGYYKPLSHPARVVVDMDRVEYWEGKGAQPSDTVASLLRKVRRGGDDSVAVGELDKEAEKQAALEALAARRRAEAEERAKADAEAKAATKAEKAAAEAKEEEPAAEAQAEEPAAEDGTEEPAAEPEADKAEKAAAEPKDEAPAAADAEAEEEAPAKPKKSTAKKAKDAADSEDE